MACILICEPVDETRELMEHLVRRLGHDVIDIDELERVDVLLFEPESRAGRALARRLRTERPEAVLISCSAMPPRGTITAPRVFASLLQPFSPSDLARVLESALQHA